MIYRLPPLRYKIIRPGMPLYEWYRRQAVKPYLLCNASLYEGARPIGTVIEAGEIVQNSGNGFGFGIMPDGAPGFGDPWRGWRDYISGYYGIVQHGAVVPRPAYGASVFNADRPRIAIGQLRSGPLCIATHGGANIIEFAQHCVDEGVSSAANLDGGGSVFLMLDNVLYHNSNRTPYNAIVGYLATNEGGESLRGIATKRMNVYDATGRLESGRYIDKNDVCEIGEITQNMLISVEYPIRDGTRRAFVRSLEGFIRG